MLRQHVFLHGWVLRHAALIIPTERSAFRSRVICRARRNWDWFGGIACTACFLLTYLTAVSGRGSLLVLGPVGWHAVMSSDEIAYFLLRVTSCQRCESE